MEKPDVEAMSLRIESIWMDAENRIIQDIVRRIKKTGTITATADYQINRLIAMGESREWVEKTLKEAMDATWPEMFELYDKVAEWLYVRDPDIYEQVNADFIPWEENRELQQLSRVIRDQTRDELVNLAQTYGFTVEVNGHKVFTPFATYWQKYIDHAIQDVFDGSRDYGSVMRIAVSQMTGSGFRVWRDNVQGDRVNYASGYSSRIPVAVRRAVMTGLNQLTGRINEYNAKKLGTDKYEVDWHAGARPSHAEWQGKIYTMAELRSICGLGEVTGLCGANCYHIYYPFVEGVQERMYTDEWLESKKADEAIERVWKGKQLNRYQQTQQQRKMETAMRAQRAKVVALREAGVEKKVINEERAKYKGMLAEYTYFSSTMSLRQQRERIYMDKLGRVG